MPSVKSKRLLPISSLILLAAFPLLPIGTFPVHVMILTLMWAILAMSWDILTGYTGQLSFAPAGFFGIGAYTAAVLSLRFEASPWMGLLSGGALAAVIGAGVGLPCLRMRGHYLALVTIAFSEITRMIIHNWVEVTGGPWGIYGYPTFPGIPSHPDLHKFYNYYVVLTLLILSAAVMYTLGERTRIGKSFKAIREDEVLAMALGINTTLHKLLAFTVSAFFAGIAGAFYAYYVLLVSPWVASSYITIMVIGMVIIGGRGTIIGPIIGALILYILSEYLRFIGVVYNLIAVGLIIMIFIIFWPKGIMGFVAGRRMLRTRRSTAPSGTLLKSEA